jgi:hypothetical protein
MKGNSDTKGGCNNINYHRRPHADMRGCRAGVGRLGTYAESIKVESAENGYT